MTLLQDLDTQAHGYAPPRDSYRSSGSPSGASSAHRTPAATRTGGGRSFRDLSVKAKLMGGFGLVALIVLIIGVMGYRGQSSLKQQADDFDHNGLDATYNLEEFGKHLLKSDTVTIEYIEAKDAAGRAEATSFIEANDKDVQEHFDAVTTEFDLPQIVLDNTKKAHALYGEYLKGRETVVFPLAAAGKTDEALAAAVDNVAKLDQAIAALEDAITANDADNARLIKELDAAANSTMRNTVILVMIGLAVAVALGFAIARSVINPTHTVAAVLDQVAQGDLRVRSDYAAADELGQMSASLNESLERTRNVVALIGGNALQMAAASEELAASAGQVAANVQTAAAGTEEMTASIQEIARNAQEATRVADHAVALAGETSQLVGDLDLASSEIGNVIEMINSIAEQTNLLALNATIEAARAGEAGRGFAVVANEVKELAQNTSTATQSIRSMVEQIQVKSGQAKEAIEEITTVIGSINESQITIASAVEEQTVTTAEMARQLAEAATGASAISGSSGETGTGSASDIARMATDLESAVGQFTY